MNGKWFIGVIAVILISLGVHSNTFVSPNQEIVVRFNEPLISNIESETIIAEVTEQLQSIGAENIRVVETLEGNLKISYYSTVAVSNIKRLLNQDVDWQLDANDASIPSSKFPVDNGSVNYKLDVVKIQPSGHPDSGLNGVLVDSKFGNEWYVNPSLCFASSIPDFEIQRIEEHYSTNTFHYETLSIDATTYKIPEVRAGPIA